MRLRNRLMEILYITTFDNLILSKFLAKLPDKKAWRTAFYEDGRVLVTGPYCVSTNVLGRQAFAIFLRTRPHNLDILDVGLSAR